MAEKNLTRKFQLGDPNFTSILVIRDPLSRLLSAYLHKCVGEISQRGQCKGENFILLLVNWFPSLELFSFRKKK